MGLVVSHLETVSQVSERSLYIYLLDYGWPDGEWERLFKRHFMRLADRASETGAVVIGSMRGVHFGNEVLSWHQVGHLDGEAVLPGILITKTHPNYFRDSGERTAEALYDLLVVPLKPLCLDETDFLRTIEGVFRDLSTGVELRNFEIAKHDVRTPIRTSMGDRIARAIEVKLGAFGVSVDLKALLLPQK